MLCLSETICTKNASLKPKRHSLPGDRCEMVQQIFYHSMLITVKHVAELLETLLRTRILPAFFLHVGSLAIFARQNAEKAIRTETLVA